MYKYTICFIKRGTEILLLNREKAIWMGRWNGVGGKLEEGESPEDCIIREIKEETGIEINSVKYKGNVTWIDDGEDIGGMYAFTAEVPEDYVYDTPVKMDEGILDWKEISWILHPDNLGVALSIPKFLPKMLSEDVLYEHRCMFEGNIMTGYKEYILNMDDISA